MDASGFPRLISVMYLLIFKRGSHDENQFFIARPM